MSAIMTYKKDTMLRIHHPEYDTSRFGPKRDDEDFIGTGYYDYASKEIYYFSSLGLMKCRYSSGKRKITKTEIIIPGQKEWNGYEFENSRFPAYLRKMIKIRNQIIYLHRDDRIFITDGKKIINLK
ncbi:MAG: hypothetical protein HZB42_08220 [Sphingobacteriales bacterium]|nr:hypothetical protein [Sphingobacteriales bacterium]